jgi:DNA topoisomerase I
MVSRVPGSKLVIVESPAKARTIAAYLGPEFLVESSIGHIRDLPERPAQMTKEERERYGEMGVAVDEGFEPLYKLDPDKKKVVADLRRKLKDSEELLLATDEDREGEAIAWHLKEELKPKVPVRRMVFHEITRGAIERALEDTRDIDQKLVDAQETRRILDRLYGYEVSPVLWRKVMRGLSAGRVQSVATRLVVERERARMRFVSAAYWDILGTFDPGGFTARLAAVDGRRVATGRDFDESGQLRTPDLARLDEQAARGLAERLGGADFTVRSVERKPYTRRPAPPFMTSTLQQEASRKLRFAARRTMRVAQALYERGYITYMRTDSTTLSESALTAARDQARQLFGPETVPEKPRHWDRKVKNAQEAHEGIRPAGDRFRTPDEVRGELDGDEHALYDLVWRRTLASQMADARGETVTVRLGARSSAGEDAEFATSGTTITAPGFLAAYEEGRDEPAGEDEGERRLPKLTEGQSLEALKLEPDGHATSPPARYTEATLVRALEERGIGRPSTYASILGTIVDRGYVFKKGTALVPAFLAFSVVQLLEVHFQQLVDYDFTARMEDDLDRIAAGDEERNRWLGRFYFGDGSVGLKELVTDLGEIDARAVNSIPLPQAPGVVVRVGRYGPYLERDGARASVPDDLAPDELTAERVEELLSRPSGDRVLGQDPDTGRDVVAREGRYGPYVTEVLPEGAKEKPRTASLFKSMSLETVSLEEALLLLTLPRVVGTSEAGDEIRAQNGRYGPYIQAGSDSRSLESEEQLFTIDEAGARALLAAPKQRRGQAAAVALRELGADPASGKAITLREGRYGPYVTDGETNASLRKGDDADTVTLERAVELLAERRARPSTPRRGRGRARRPASN